MSTVQGDLCGKCRLNCLKRVFSPPGCLLIGVLMQASGKGMRGLVTSTSFSPVYLVRWFSTPAGFYFLFLNPR